MEPVNDLCEDTLQQVRLVVSNTGGGNVSDFPVKCYISGSITDTLIILYTDTLVLSGEDTVLMGTINTVGASTYNLESFTDYAGDSVRTNDTLQSAINSVIINPTADFSISGTGQDFTFTNASASFDSLVWSFGDGDTSHQSNPNHSYTGNGTFDVCLSAFNNQICRDSACKKVTFNIT